ncbi:MAG: hypothetical protein ACI4ME_02755 [Aristaeellaceae bacterium]
MRKVLSLVLCLMMLLCGISAVAEEATPVKTGLSFVTSLEKSKDGQSQANIALTAVAVDDNGVITACVIDAVQGKVKFDETGKITSDLTAEVLSKNELGDGYGMRKASSITAEWNEQAAAFAAYCVGKTVEELAGMAVNENGVSIDLATSCTLAVDDFLPGVVEAVNNAEHMGAKKGDVLKLVQVSSIAKSKDATAEADGQTQLYTHVGVFTLDGDVITSAYIDAVQANVKFNAEGKITSDITVAVETKNALKERYGMKPISSIPAEWYEQTASFCQFITGKTLNEAIAVAANPAETDVVSSCTIKTGDFLKLIVKAGL